MAAETGRTSRSAFGLVLAMLGVYAVVAFMTAQRLPEACSRGGPPVDGGVLAVAAATLTAAALGAARVDPANALRAD